MKIILQGLILITALIYMIVAGIAILGISIVRGAF